MLYYSIATLLTATAAVAEVMTLSTPYPFLNIAYAAQGDIAVSTVGIHSHTTTYNVTCPTVTAIDCDFPSTGATVIDGPSTIALTWTDEDVTYTVGCAPTTVSSVSTSLAACSTTMYGPGITEVSGYTLTTISAVFTWGGNAMSMFATGTQDTAFVVTIPTGLDTAFQAASTATATGTASTSTATGTAATTTSTSGALKEMELPRWSFFGVLGALLTLGL